MTLLLVVSLHTVVIYINKADNKLNVNALCNTKAVTQSYL